jgi:hypothetical protein
MLSFLLDVRALAQEEGYRLSKLDWHVSRDEVVVTYDLEGDPDDAYVVSMVLMRESDRTFRFKPILVSGKIGEGKFAGKDNEIRWSYKHDYPQGFEGDDYYVELHVENAGSFPWLIAASGAAIAGIVAVLASSSKTSEQKSDAFQLPFPPPRP